MALLRQVLLALATLMTATVVHGQSFTFTGQGQVIPTGAPSPSGDLPLVVVNTTYDLPGAGIWSLQSGFVFNLVTGAGTGSFQFSQGTNSFFGTLTTQQAVVAGTAGFEIGYSVTGGTGQFAGVTGSGSSLTQLLDPLTGPPPYDYLEAGIMSLVPEPAALLLMLAGVAGLAAWRRGFTRPHST